MQPRGDVLNVSGFNFPPLLASEGTGFAVTQGYSTLYFFYKFNQVNNASLYVTLNFYDATNGSAGFGVSTILHPPLTLRWVVPQLPSQAPR
jgi:hypothetical protein